MKLLFLLNFCPPPSFCFPMSGISGINIECLFSLPAGGGRLLPSLSLGSAEGLFLFKHFFLFLLFPAALWLLWTGDISRLLIWCRILGCFLGKGTFLQDGVLSVLTHCTGLCWTTVCAFNSAAGVSVLLYLGGVDSAFLERAAAWVVGAKVSIFTPVAAKSAVYTRQTPAGGNAHIKKHE